MKRLDVTATIIDELESVMDTVYNNGTVQTDAPIPVHTWNGVDSTETPVMLVDDREGHISLPVGNTHYNGAIVDPNTGNEIAEELIEFSEGTYQLVTRIRHQTDAYRLIAAVKDHFRVVENDPRRFFGNDFRTLEVEREYTKEVEFRSPSDVYQEALPVCARYVDTIQDDYPEPLESFNNDITEIS